MESPPACAGVALCLVTATHLTPYSIKDGCSPRFPRESGPPLRTVNMSKNSTVGESSTKETRTNVSNFLMSL